MADSLGGMDYYAVLNVPHSATIEDINVAYRKLAVRLHPGRDPQYERDFTPSADDDILDHMAGIPKMRQWDYINMAYDVLSDEMRRSVYDNYGEVGLLEGVALPNGFAQPYSYHGDCMRTYISVFKTDSPYANIMDAVTNPPVLYTSREFGIGRREPDPPMYRIVDLTLEEVNSGCVKLMTVFRMEMDENDFSLQQKKATLTLNISPGTLAGTHYTFREAGDQHPTRIAADIVFITADKRHPTFKRINDHDLLYVRKIPLCDALVGFRFEMETLDQRKLTIIIIDVASPDYSKIIPGEGLPKCTNDLCGVSIERTPPRRGDLILKFEAIFPLYMDPSMRKIISKCFDEVAEHTAWTNTPLWPKM